MPRRMELKPGIGIDGIKFGMSQDEVKQLLGTPDEEERYDNGDVAWWFSSMELYIFFRSDNFQRMDLIETSNVEARLWDVVVIGIELTELLQLFQKHGFEAPEVIDEGEGEFLYRYPGCNVYVEENFVTSIQSTVLFDDRDNVVWPWPKKDRHN